jgi:hypothetical protein
MRFETAIFASSFGVGAHLVPIDINDLNHLTLRRATRQALGKLATPPQRQKVISLGKRVELPSPM